MNGYTWPTRKVIHNCNLPPHARFYRWVIINQEQLHFYCWLAFYRMTDYYSKRIFIKRIKPFEQLQRWWNMHNLHGVWKSHKVSFNIASEASYVYNRSWQKFLKNAKTASFGTLVKQCYQTGQKLVDYAKIEKFKCDILGDFETMWATLIRNEIQVYCSKCQPCWLANVTQWRFFLCDHV